MTCLVLWDKASDVWVIEVNNGRIVGYALVSSGEKSLESTYSIWEIMDLKHSYDSASYYGYIQTERAVCYEITSYKVISLLKSDDPITRKMGLEIFLSNKYKYGKLQSKEELSKMDNIYSSHANNK